jgi:hypothetical protein
MVLTVAFLVGLGVAAGITTKLVDYINVAAVKFMDYRSYYALVLNTAPPAHHAYTPSSHTWFKATGLAIGFATATAAVFIALYALFRRRKPKRQQISFGSAVARGLAWLQALHSVM